MAFVVTAETNESAAASSYSQEIPAGHRADDWLLAIVFQDAGGTAYGGLASGWSAWSGTAQAAENAQRTHFFLKKATSDAEPDFTITGANDEWACCIVVIRGAHGTTPVSAATRTSVTGTTPASSTQAAAANSLVLYALGFDGVSRLCVPQNPGDLVFLGKSKASGAGCLMVGYRNQIAADTAPAVTMLASHTDGGSFWTIVVADDGDNNMGPDCRQSYEVLRYHGMFADQHDAITWGALTAIAALGAASIDGLPVDTTAPAVNVATATWPAGTWNNAPTAAGEGAATLQHSNNLGADAWVGGSYALSPAVNMTDKVFGVRFAANIYTSPAGSKGWIVVFEDGAGAWAAFRLSQLSGLPTINNTSHFALIDLSNYTPLASGGSIVWTNIVRVGYGSHRVAGSTNSRSIILCDSFLIPGTVVVGGSAASPVGPQFIDQIMRGWSDNEMAKLQGAGQALIRAKVQFGDGAVKTYVDTSATSIEFPKPWNSSLALRFWRVPEDVAEIRIKASAADTVRFVASVAATTSSQSFVIDSASSPSATYDFAGLAMVGWKITNNVSGITLNGVTMSGCRGVTLNGGSMSGCSVANTLSASAVTTSVPGNISTCNFVSNGTGHAIEITTPGTYTFAGNTFDGYGLADTTDAAIYNNSGGAVTLNITGGGDTPTVRNGSGATTTVNNNVTITVDNLVVGSAIRVERVSDGSEVEFRTAASATETFSVSASINYRIKVRQGTTDPKYAPWQTNTGVITGDTTVFAAQVLDPIA